MTKKKKKSEETIEDTENIIFCREGTLEDFVISQKECPNSISQI